MAKLRKIGSLGTLLVLVAALAVGVFAVQNRQTIMMRAVGVEQVANCGGIQISPEQAVYKPGDRVAVTVAGSGAVANIQVRQAASRRNIIQVPYVATDIPGSYNPTTKVWTGNWTLPGDGEYIVMVNLYQTNGQMCAGNPAYACSGCRTGTMVGAGITAGTYPCNGCHKTIVVDGNYGNTTGYDMKQYWNLTPGNYWVYEGENVKCGVGTGTALHNCASGEGKFTTRVAVEEKVNVCGHVLTPQRFTKSSPVGYILPNWEENFRRFDSYFEPGEKWSAGMVGRPISKGYIWMASANQLASLGAVGLQWATWSMSTDPAADFENVYYPPHYFMRQFVQPGWKYEGIDKMYWENMSVLNSCDWPYKANVRERYTNNQLFEDYVQTSAYTGPALRLRLVEAGNPPGSGWYLREDWYFVKEIGRVQVDYKDLVGKCVNLPAGAQPDPDCTGTAKMAKPDVSMKLASYYIGGALTTRVEPATTTGNSTWTLYATTSQGKPYTGFLEAKNCISEASCTPGGPFRWGYGDGTYFWMDNGQVTVDMTKVRGTKMSGLRHAWFRPMVDKPPADAVGEMVITNTQLPWSNEATWRVTY